MTTFLVLYGTGEGQTSKIATRIADVIDNRGHDVRLVDAGDVPAALSIDDFEAVIVGASIHAGAHQSSVREFVVDHREVLERKPTAFFQVSLSSADESGEPKAAEYVEAFLEETDWNPDRIGLFGGALRYSKYGFLKRLMMKQIAKRAVSEMPKADAAGDIEFTDWNEVEAFAADVSAFVEGRLGSSPPESADRDETV
ncbi:protoporphyrinogen oxidase [Halobacteria archaeon AArc-curdl1]|uniref:Protoporphyrinogen oxidase n=1 Tax=Natronosalvus hydrolyticus TaxID=2979988 RepID=A0AAP2Z600_9EURY|nr:protoporphyrinogen oxidase [Halobacteria archaeon AArc-curdl1]